MKRYAVFPICVGSSSTAIRRTSRHSVTTVSIHSAVTIPLLSSQVMFWVNGNALLVIFRILCREQETYEWRFRAINSVSEKQRGRKVYILVAFGESFPTIYNVPTCDKPMGLRWYSTVFPPTVFPPQTHRLIAGRHVMVGWWFYQTALMWDFIECLLKVSIYNINLNTLVQVICPFIHNL